MKLIYKLFLAVSFAATLMGCSKDDNGGNNNSDPNTPREGTAKCWALKDGNFLTDQDVIMSTDSTTMNVSKALIERMEKVETIRKGDAVVLVNHGLINYYQVEEAKENGENYMTYKVTDIGLEKTLALCKIDMGKVQLSTAIYVDKNLPRRVNNSGEADPTGTINSKIYEEHAADGTIIYHPEAVCVPVIEEGMNADDEDAVIPGGFTGCYVGQGDNLAAANGFFSKLSSIVKTTASYIITPIKTHAKILSDTAEILAKLAVGGEFADTYEVVDIEHEFTGQMWNLKTFKPKEDKDSTVNLNKGGYTKEELKAKVKGKLMVGLTGHVTAKAGARMNITFSPGSIDKFSVGGYANVDLDANATVLFGATLTANRPLVIYRFLPKHIVFNIGPVPVAIVVYPEVIWNNTIQDDFTAWVNFDVKYNMNYDVDMQLKPEYDMIWNNKKNPSGDFDLRKFGFSGKGSAKTGIYFRTSWELYGVAGPVFDFGVSLSYQGTVEAIKEKDKDWDVKGNIEVAGNIGELVGSAAIKFPPLQAINEWLYKKLTFETKSLIHPDPLYKIKFISVKTPE